ncbi:DUF3168 domain-containing protein [Streptomyces odonnellii]|uniref:DUF3168 domain-containing protein n=1 Tax=Streptomyces odonnellii TaxID=1417980 RepID=UPI000626D021|nr:DUF3168 domain-containing protein [Streptomyces odonnellii]
MTTAPFPIPAVQDAVYTRLTGDDILMSLISGVYDYVPETADFPYVVIGDATEIPDNAHDTFGRQTTLTLHVWTRSRTHAKGLAIAARLVALLDHQPLTIPGLHHVSTLYEFAQPLVDPEPPGDIRHVVLRFRIRTEQPA